MAKCPVCENEIDEVAARAVTGQTAHGADEVNTQKGTRMFHNGQWYYFDTLDCRSKFVASPEAYLKQAGS